ncbi:uncharacterized protein FIBRA_05497 [Fibroporia radiculosa]|uniref:18S rRNA factor 2 n=1 Tax=Fibroporia radiculosa TaxID=599839 RepID=J4HXM2_9APHY|nr:uncharacterized protein FIBRA_05497 [Fibroporia radiculosa]CCM03367.1 predicted protein [Fibroporia radiculosa]
MNLSLAGSQLPLTSFFQRGAQTKQSIKRRRKSENAAGEEDLSGPPRKKGKQKENEPLSVLRKKAKDIGGTHIDALLRSPSDGTINQSSPHYGPVRVVEADETTISGNNAAVGERDCNYAAREDKATSLSSIATPARQSKGDPRLAREALPTPPPTNAVKCASRAYSDQSSPATPDKSALEPQVSASIEGDASLSRLVEERGPSPCTGVTITLSKKLQLQPVLGQFTFTPQSPLALPAAYKGDAMGSALLTPSPSPSRPGYPLYAQDFSSVSRPVKGEVIPSSQTQDLSLVCASSSMVHQVPLRGQGVLAVSHAHEKGDFVPSSQNQELDLYIKPDVTPTGLWRTSSEGVSTSQFGEEELSIESGSPAVSQQCLRSGRFSIGADNRVWLPGKTSKSVMKSPEPIPSSQSQIERPLTIDAAHWTEDVSPQPPVDEGTLFHNETPSASYSLAKDPGSPCDIDYSSPLAPYVDEQQPEIEQISPVHTPAASGGIDSQILTSPLRAPSSYSASYQDDEGGYSRTPTQLRIFRDMFDSQPSWLADQDSIGSQAQSGQANERADPPNVQLQNDSHQGHHVASGTEPGSDNNTIGFPTWHRLDSRLGRGDDPDSFGRPYSSSPARPMRALSPSECEHQPVSLSYREALDSDEIASETAHSMDPMNVDTRFATDSRFAESPEAGPSSSDVRRHSEDFNESDSRSEKTDDEVEASEVDDADSLGNGMDPDGFAGPLQKVVKPLTAEALSAFKAAQDKAGVVYVSRIPPGMRPTKVRHIMSEYGEVGRVYLQQEDPKRAYLRRKYTATKKAHFTEGWVEFKDKKVARSVADMLNAQPIGGKKGTRWRDDVWTMKYLPKFKWNMLTEQIAHEAALHAAQLRAELSQSRREQREYLKNVELARVLDKRSERKRKAQPETSVEAAEGMTRPRKKGKDEKEQSSTQVKKQKHTHGDSGEGELDNVLQRNAFLFCVHHREHSEPVSPSIENAVLVVCRVFRVVAFLVLLSISQLVSLNMSAWSGAAYPPPPPPRGRSRSRSPYRGSYPPRPAYPEPGYPQDPYRADWEAYDRDRAWANYERERAAYEYSRRGRSRSPPADEAGRKRRRSLSPWERDRYEPRPRYGDDYDTHSRGYGYGGSPHRGQYPPPPYGGTLRRAPPDPHTFDYAASLKQYAEWFRYFYPQQAIEEDNADKAAEQEAGDGSKPRNGIRTRWEKYKKDFSAQQLQRMFEHHRKSPWFSEKYEPAPEYTSLRTRVRKVGWRGRMDAFLLDLETGKFDPDLNEPEPDVASPTKDSAPSGDTTSNAVDASSTQAGHVEEQKPAINAGGGDDDMQFNVEAEDEGGDNEANRLDTNGKASSDPKRNSRGEEVSVLPEGNQVMIRTIPPDIGRMKLEDSCGKIPGFVYLALGDPLQKRNYYRAGWLKFRDDADMATIMAELSDKKIEGFKLHVAHITKPFVSRVRYAPEVASKPDRMSKDLANVKILAAILEEECASLRKVKIEQKEPNADVSADGDAAMADGLSTEDEDPEPKERGSDAVERRIEKVMADMRDQGLIDAADERVLEAKKTVVSLDLYLAYLRAAFHTCYYCAVVTDHLEELQRKCVKHVRKPMSKALLQEVKAAEAQKAERELKVEGALDDEKLKEKEKDAPVKEKSENRDWKRNDERWLEWLDSKVALLINRAGVDPRDYGGKSYEEELSKAAEPFMKQEDEGKYRCKTCQKLFKATSFVEKHIANKHPELVKHLEEIPYFNNFALDPHRIQPFAHPPPLVGNSQAPPPQAYGLQGPAYAPPSDYGRPAAYQGSYGGYPPYANGNYWDPYAYPYHPGAYPPPRKDEGVTARRLSDRISGYAPGYEQNVEPPPVPASAGLPAKPVATLEPGPGGRRGGRGGASGPPPPPPPDAKEDPRASAGKKVSYHDMDLVAEGDVELQY